MDLKTINVGLVANDGTGDSPRAAWIKQMANNALLAAAAEGAAAAAAQALAVVQALQGGVTVDVPLEVDDADCLVPAGVTVVALLRVTAPRVVTLPYAAAYPARRPFVVADESGGVSAAVPLIVRRRGTDTIAGQTEVGLIVPYGGLTFRSNGANLWTVA